MRLQPRLIVATLALSTLVQAQQKPAPPLPDELLLNDGEKLIGHLERATSANITFKSDVLGEVTIDWSKIKELHAAEKFAVIPKTTKLKNQTEAASVPVGALAVENQQVAIAPANNAATTTTVPVNTVGNVVAQPDFQKAFEHTNFFRGWKGAATAGVSITEATQDNQSFTGAINLVRSTPSVNWLDPRTRTLLNFDSAYSNLSQPGTPSIKTSLTHFDGEQDWYISPRFFVLGTAALDHSFSQGLKLQQDYGVGVGYVAIKTANQELDLRVSANYIEQKFEDGTSNNLVGSQFGETYARKFPKGILFSEGASFTPSWNQTNDYTWLASAGLTFPVYHRLGFTIGALDNYVNDPPVGFKKNSFQLTVGATYTLP